MNCNMQEYAIIFAFWSVYKNFLMLIPLEEFFNSYSIVTILGKDLSTKRV